MMIDLPDFTGPAAFGRAYETMLANDAHADGSVDRVLLSRMIRVCPETAGYLYGSFTPTEVRYEKGSRPQLESILSGLSPGRARKEGAIDRIVEFTAGLAPGADCDPGAMIVGGTEEQIIQRGSDWCPNVARVACVLCRIAGFPARIVTLFNLDKAYSGHVIVEAFRVGKWGALDSSTGIVYRGQDGRPASTWDLMSNPGLVEAHRSDPRAFYTSVGQFRSAGLANYFCWQADQYDYSTSRLNDYYLSIQDMSDKGWPGGLRWLHGEDARRAEQKGTEH